MGSIGLAMCALLFSLSCALAETKDIGAYVLFDMADGRIIAKHNASKRWFPASLTKLMTAYVTFEAVNQEKLAMTSPVTISAQARQQPPSRMGFAKGAVITVETALRIILTKSANDVSVALAEAVGGTSGQFVSMMNETAARLGMGSSAFDNPHGLPNQKQVTSARDVAVLMRALQDDFPQYADFFDMSAVRLGQRTLRNHNRMIRRVEGADGFKTGFICASGFNLAASATRDGVRLGAVVLGGRTSRERDERTAELLEKGFDAVENGGRVTLDGFGDPEAVLVHAPVAGTGGDYGTVEELPAADQPVVSIRSVVCGARRPTTRYDNGTVSTLPALEAQREKMLEWQALRARRERMIEAALSRTDQSDAASEDGIASPIEAGSAGERPVPADGPEREFAESDLLPASWTSSLDVAFPPFRPVKPVALVAKADFAPEDFTPSPLRPPRHPLSDPSLRAPLPEKPEARPLSYLGAAIGKPPVSIRMGGADKSRPNPLSGDVVGGGPAPLPKTKPVVAADAEEPAKETRPADENT